MSNNRKKSGYLLQLVPRLDHTENGVLNTGSAIP